MEALKPNHSFQQSPDEYTHKNAALTPKGRAHLVSQIAPLGWVAAAQAAGISCRTARRWQRRFVAEGYGACLSSTVVTPGLCPHCCRCYQTKRHQQDGVFACLRDWA